MIDLTDTVTVTQAAAIAAVDRETILRWIHTRKLDATKIGTDWFIRKPDLEAYLAARARARARARPLSPTCL